MNFARKGRGPVLASLLIAAPIAFTGAGCADTSTSQSDSEGINAGATKEQYQDAFEGLDTMTFATQVPGPKGSPTSADIVAYLDDITDWSGGKIQFDISFSNAIAEPGEQDDALVDGRLDIAPVLPIYDPAEYPVTNFFRPLLRLCGDQCPGVLDF